MANSRLTPPPINVDANDWTFKKWFNNVYDFSEGGILIPVVDSNIQQYGYRNLLINGSFQINQRAAAVYTVTASTAYTFDRWAIKRPTVASFSVFPEPSPPTGFPAAAQISRSGSDTTIDEIFFINMSESKMVQHVKGKMLVLSFWIKCSSNFQGTAFTNGKGLIEFNVVSGTGTDEGPFSALTGASTVLGGSLTPTTQWTYYQFFGTAPSNCNELKTYFGWVPKNTTTGGTFSVAGVQLEIARSQTQPKATAYEWVPFDIELRRCKRYYQKSFLYSTVPAQNAGTSSAMFYRATASGISAANSRHIQALETEIRTGTPVVTTYNPSAANANWRNTTLNTDSGVPTIGTISGMKVVSIINPQVAGDVLGNDLGIHWTVDSELF